MMATTPPLMMLATGLVIVQRMTRMVTLVLANRFVDTTHDIIHQRLIQRGY